MKNLILFFLLILLFASCRNENYTPTEVNELFDFDPDFEVFHKPQKGNIFYLGDEIDVEYRVFSNSDFINLYAEKKGSIMFTIAENVPNTGQFKWQTNKQMIPSVHYQIRIVNPNNQDIYALSERFGIISK
ncbi:MAG: Ser-Thr-rich GPI-anchored membrane family protein [Melioribacteraceae bacterium]|nr:GPI anchored serine-threonine rich family protein [Melioribacteraceae bacterium]WKZ70228.1 MAG: Ser-Thr-rich GPI-anchored membrane family protein [Melioribacteraceae bacterium]